MNTVLHATDSAHGVKLANAARLASPNKWLFLEIHTPGKDRPLLVKSFGTSIQLMRRGDVSSGRTRDMKAGDWKARVLHGLEA